MDYMKTNWESLSVFTRIHNLFDGNNQGFKVDGSGANRLVQMLVDPGCPIGRVDAGKDGQCAWRTASVRLVGHEKMWRPIRLCLLHFGYTHRPQFFLSEDMKPNYVEIVEEESQGHPDYYLQQMYGGKVASCQAVLFELGLASKFFGFDVVIFDLLNRKAVMRAVHKRDGPAVDGEIPSVQDSFWGKLNNSALGLDGLSKNIIFPILSIISPAVASLFSALLRFSVSPSDWKIAVPWSSKTTTSPAAGVSKSKCWPSPSIVHISPPHKRSPCRGCGGIGEIINGDTRWKGTRPSQINLVQNKSNIESSTECDNLLLFCPSYVIIIGGSLAQNSAAKKARRPLDSDAMKKTAAISRN